LTGRLLQNGVTSRKSEARVPSTVEEAQFSSATHEREKLCRPGRRFPRPFLTITAAAFAVVCPFFLLGILAGHDFKFHVNSWMEVAAQWKQGIVYPRWAALANYGYGEPRFVFYPPASWILGAALGTVLPWKLVPGAFVWIALTLSGCSMFYLARTWLNMRDAVFAAALYATNPYYLVIVYWRSDFAELLAGALLPLLVLFLLQTPDRGSRPLIALSLIIAGAWLINAPVGVMVNYLVAFFSLVIALTRRSMRALVVGIGAVLLRAGLAGFYLLPAAYEQKWVAIGQVLANGFRPGDNFLFTATGDPGHDAFNRLLTLVSLFEIAIVSLAVWFVHRSRTVPRAKAALLFTLAITTSVLMFSVTSPLWRFLPKLEFLQFPWRWLLCLSVAFASLVASAWQSRSVRVALYFGMVGVLVFGAWRIQRPWKDTGADIAHMADTQRTGQGYKSRPEYVPLGANVDRIDQNTALATVEGGRAEADIRAWQAEDKVITIHSSQPGWVALRLFNYPGWHAYVNERPVPIDDLATTGQVSVPVPTGQAQIRLKFQRTSDRGWGIAISTMAFLVLTGMVLLSNRPINWKEASNV